MCQLINAHARTFIQPRESGGHLHCEIVHTKGASEFEEDRTFVLALLELRL